MCPVWLFVLLINSDRPLCRLPLFVCVSGGLAQGDRGPSQPSGLVKLAPLVSYLLAERRAGAAGSFPQHWPHPPAVTLDSS